MQQRGKKKRNPKSALLQRNLAAVAEVLPLFYFSLRRNKTKLFHTGFYYVLWKMKMDNCSDASNDIKGRNEDC